MNIAIFQIFIACGDSTAQSNLDTTPPAPSTSSKEEAVPSQKDSTPQPKETPNTQLASDTSGMPNLLKGLATGGCDNGPGIFGAADYFYNEFSINGTDVIGSETWILYPNKKMAPKWAAEGVQESCKVTWNLKGKTQPVTLYEVLDGLPKEEREYKISIRDAFLSARTSFQQGNFDMI